MKSRANVAYLLACAAIMGLTGCATSKVSTKPWKEYTRKAESAEKKNDLPTADKYYTLALQEAENFGPGRRLSDTLENLSDIRFSLRKYAQAEELRARRVEIDSKRMMTNTFEFAREILSLAEAQEAQRKFDRAEENYLRAEAIVSRRLGPSSTVLGLFVAKRARLYTIQGRYIKAEQCFEESKANLETLQRAQDPLSIGNGSAIIQIANYDYALLSEKQGKYAKAETLIEESISLLEHQTGKNSARIVYGLNNLARISAKANNLKKAEVTARRSVAIVEKSLPPAHPVRIDTHKLLASIQAQQSQ